ncbi:MAG: tRNA (guanosine(46)-N7)-methyltransferase TrmB [Chitinophagaceae bacterium]|nr:tRNA (guanosine(46)-N7)-methyltransferase TrmB [Chitinophagaceae bacterium]
MGHKKLIRFEAIKSFRNVLQYPEGMAGKWKDFFGNENDITLELACGKGEYTVGLAGKYPGRNFIGVDLKGNRIWAGAKKCLDENLANAAFLRTQIERITDYFAPGEVKEIWITFPDPQLRLSRAKKRLTHPRFLRLYQKIVVPGGHIHLKTDSPDLYRFTKTVTQLYQLPVLSDLDDVYNKATISEELQIKTYYENLDIAKSNRVHYLEFTLINEISPDKEEQLKQSELSVERSS